MLKRVGLVAVAALAAALTLTSAAYADDDDNGDGLSGHTEQNEEQECDHDLLSGKLIIPEDDGSENNSDNDVDCDQDLDD